MPVKAASKSKTRTKGKGSGPAWWTRLSADKQRAYLKDHPNSRLKVAGRGGRVAGKPKVTRSKTLKQDSMKPRTRSS